MRGAGLAEHLATARVWLSLAVEGEVVAGDSAGEEPLTDWRLVVGPPLLLENQLPVRATYLVWERSQVSCCPARVWGSTGVVLDYLLATKCIHPLLVSSPLNEMISWLYMRILK